MNSEEGTRRHNRGGKNIKKKRTEKVPVDMISHTDVRRRSQASAVSIAPERTRHETTTCSSKHRKKASSIDSTPGDDRNSQGVAGGGKRRKKRRRQETAPDDSSTKTKTKGRRANPLSKDSRDDDSLGESLLLSRRCTEELSTNHSSRGSVPTAGSAAPSRLSELQKRMRQKLEGAQFRMINEALYTCESGASLARFREEPELFDVKRTEEARATRAAHNPKQYHRGFREQVEKWPVHPLDIIIDWVGKYPKARVVDFGCGEARLAASVPNKVHSFDLISPNSRVTACDMAHVPLKDASVHVAVFCLSLMGTNLADFLREAHRVLVPGGLVKVAEVRSRFEGEEGGVEGFLDVARQLGFDSKQMDRTNKMFLLAEFKKSNRRPQEGVAFEAKACVYKRR